MISFDTALLNIRTGINVIGITVITVAAVRSIGQLVHMAIHRNVSPNSIRLQFGNAVILGMEFMVGADLIGSLANPDYYNLGLLAILVLIRTVLSYFLSRELEALSRKERKALA